jgi:hypothetical protein
MFGQEGRKQQEQVENREHEQVGSIAASGTAASAQPECEYNEDRPADSGGRGIDHTDKTECPREQRNRNQEHAVHEDLPRCGALSGNDQHGDASTGGIRSSRVERPADMVTFIRHHVYTRTNRVPKTFYLLGHMTSLRAKPDPVACGRARPSDRVQACGGSPHRHRCCRLDACAQCHG